jgi:hypothetical protein
MEQRDLATASADGAAGDPEGVVVAQVQLHGETLSLSETPEAPSADPLAAHPQRPVRVGRLLRLFRLAAGLRLEEAAVALEVTPARVRQVESGESSLAYLEGIVLAKAYMLCPTCFARHFRAAAAQELASDGARGDDAR